MPDEGSPQANTAVGVARPPAELESPSGSISLTKSDIDNAVALEDPQARQQAFTKFMAMAIAGMSQCDRELGNVPDKAIPQILRAKANYLAIAKNIVESMGKVVSKEIHPPKGGKANKIIEVSKIRTMGSEADLDLAETQVRKEMAGENTVQVGENGEISF